MTETEAARRLRIYLERIERLEEERKTIADDIAEVYKELSGDGFDKDATKVVLRIRKNADALAVWTARSETVDMYLSALGMLPESLPARAPARVREIIEEFPPHDAETGVIIEQNSSDPTSSPEKTDTAATLADVAATNSNSVAALAPQAQPATAEAGVDPLAAPADKFEPPAFLQKDRKPLRPHCLHPDDLEKCAGSGREHCHACTKAMAESEAA